MYRIDSLGFLANGNGAGKNAFANGDPAGGVRGTELEDTWLNELQEELCNVPAAVGTPLIKGNRTQLLSSIKALMWPMALSNWAAITVGATVTNGAFMHRRAANGRMIIAQGNTGANFYTSDDDGSSWTARTKGGASTSIMLQYAESASKIMCAENVAAGASMFAQQSVDGGTTWTRPNITGTVVPPLHATNLQPLYAIAYSPTLNLWVASCSHYIFSSTDGLAWTFRYNLSTPTNGGFVWKIIWTGTSFIAVGHDGTGGGTTSARIARSTDGINWTPSTYFNSYTSPSFAVDQFVSVDVNTTTGRVIAVGRDTSGTNTNGVIQVSDNDGQSFTLATANGGGAQNLNDGILLPTVGVGGTTRYVIGIGCDPTRNTWVAVTGGPHILTSTDDGESWMRRVPDSSANNFPSPCSVVLGRRVLVPFNTLVASVMASKLNRY